MSRYEKEWPCCGDISITNGYEPESCPFCGDASKKKACMTRDDHFKGRIREAILLVQQREQAGLPTTIDDFVTAIAVAAQDDALLASARKVVSQFLERGAAHPEAIDWLRANIARYDR